jgi:hypothetical protein
MSARRARRESRVLTRWLAAVMLCAVLGPPAWALQRTLKTKVHNYPNTPVTAKRPKAQLVETFAAPTQIVAPGIKSKTTRVRYANRAGLAPSVFVVSGSVECTNTAAQAVEAMSITIIALDAFHQAIPMMGQAGQAYLVKQITEPLPRGATKPIEWEEQVNSSDVFEVAIVVTRARFADGSVWLAPGEELLDIF